MPTFDLTVEIIGRHTSPEQLYRAALDHANAQADAITPRPVTIRMTTAEGVKEYRDIHGVVGFAGVRVPAGSDFAQWAVAAKKGTPARDAVVFSSDPWVRDSLERSAAWAAAFAAVLCEAHIRADLDVGID